MTVFPEVRTRAIALANVCVLTAGLLVLSDARAGTFAAGAHGQRPNIVVVMTDDQDVESMRFMPKTRKLLAGRGVTFDNAFVSFPLCCPARATFLTGAYAHNHEVFFNEPPYGYAALRGKEVLPGLLAQAGYRSIHVGKYLNGYGAADPTEIPTGWTRFFAPVGTGAHWYHGFTMNENGVLKRYGRPEDPDPRTYATDVVRDIALSEIETAIEADDPFFLSVAPLAPHGELNYPGQDRRDDPRSARRHADLYTDLQAPRSPAWDEGDVSDKPGAVRRLDRLGPGAESMIDRLYRARARSLRAADDLVGKLVRRLETAGVLEDTWLVFTSDNGFMTGQHRLRYGKYVPYEPSIRVPLIVAGPGVPKGARAPQLVSNVDLAPTILELARVEPPARFDGRSMLPFVRDPGRVEERLLLFESMPAPGRTEDLSVLEELLQSTPIEVTPYQAVRSSRYKYVEYLTGEVELYDLLEDPYEMDSVADDPSYARIRAFLAAGLKALRACRGPRCRAAESRPLAFGIS